MTPRGERREYAAWTALVALWWAPAFGYFFAQEDFDYLLRAQELGWRAWLPAGPLARPLVYGGWMQLGRILCDLDPVRWHAANVAIHAANTALMGLVLRRLGLRHGQAIVGMLVYGFAPLHYNTVVWVQNIHPALATGFALAAIYSGLGARTRSGAALVVFWCTLALASNEMAVAVAPVLVALEWSRGRPVLDALRGHAIPVGIVAIYVVARLAGFGGSADSEAHQQLYTLTLGPNAIENAGRYGLVLATPVWLLWILARGRAWIVDGAWLGAGCMALAILVSLRAVRAAPARTHEAPTARRTIIAAWLWMGAALAPSVVLTSFYPYRGAFAAAGFALLIAACAHGLGASLTGRAVVAAVLAALMTAAWRIVPHGDTLRVKDKQAIARHVLADLGAYLQAHPETAAVHIPSLTEPHGLGAAATYWGRAVPLFFPQVEWVEDRAAVTRPTIVFHVENGRLVAREQWRPSG